MKPGDRFLFSGRILELVRVHEMTAFVKRSESSTRRRQPLERRQGAAVAPSWRTPAREELKLASEGVFDGPEMRALRPLFEIQARWSALPTQRRAAWSRA